MKGIDKGTLDTNEVAKVMNISVGTLLKNRHSDPEFPKPLAIYRRPYKWRESDIVEYLRLSQSVR